MKKKTKICIIVASAFTAVLGIATILLFTLRIEISPLQVGLLYCGIPSDNTAQYFEQPLVLNMNFSRISNNARFQDFDLIVVDGSAEFDTSLLSFVENGGRLALTASSVTWLDFFVPNLQMSIFTPSQSIYIPAQNDNHDRLGQIFKDYYNNFVRFADYETLRYNEAGISLYVSPQITPIVYTLDRTQALAAVISYGDGFVYYFGGLLPDPFFTTSFDFVPRQSELPYFNHTTSAAEHLLWNELASAVSRDVRGFSLERVFGQHGRPSMAHQNHSEVLSALALNHMEIWAQIAQEHGQIASFSLAYGQYEWFYRYESFGYALGNPDGSFQNDRTRNFYAWGTPIVNNETQRWLNLAQSPSRLSYFADPDEATRPFPAVIDFNGDGIPDLISGSSDGYFHVFLGMQIYPRWIVERYGKLIGQDEAPLNVGGFSAPTFCTEQNIMVSGSYGGNVYIWQWHGELQIGELISVIPPPAGETLSAPDIVQGSIYIGFASGNIYRHDLASGQMELVLETGEKNVAPRRISDGFIVGTWGGDILHFVNGERSFLQEAEGLGAINFRNTGGINSGNNIAPLLVDLTGDDTLDLVWGLLEYGSFSVALSDDFFPYTEHLLTTLATLEQMFVPMALHNYTHNYRTLEDERATLLAEMAAFKALGITVPIGINQHTWWTSGQGDFAQTLHLQAEMGFLYNSGFQPSRSPAFPADYAEFAMVTPFFFTGQNGHTMLLYNSNYLHDGFAASARYNLPITIYRHTWAAAINNPSALEYFALDTRWVQEMHMYNFVNEMQLFQSMSAAMATEVRVYARPIDLLFDWVRGLTGRSPRFDRHLVVEHKNPDAPLFDEIFANSAGVRITLGNDMRPYLDTNSAVRWYKDNAFYISLATENRRGIHIWTRYEHIVPNMHLVAVNLPAQITHTNNEITIDFQENGLQQFFLHSTQPFTLNNDDFTIRHVREHLYKIFWTGEATTIEITRIP